jgi:hypothetical protein
MSPVTSARFSTARLIIEKIPRKQRTMLTHPHSEDYELRAARLSAALNRAQ